MRVCVIGTGYVGLVTGVCLATIGHSVLCVDNNPAKVAMLQSGQSPIYEPGLDSLMADAIAANRLQFTTDLKSGVDHGEVLFIAVGTPALPSGESDTRYVEAVARGIGQHLNGGYKIIVNKSTVPIGSGDWVRQIISDEVATRQGQIAGFDIVSNPEFLREGSAVYDTFNPDRIVLGSSSQPALSVMQELYAPIVKRHCPTDLMHPDSIGEAVPIVITDLTSAEMIKYAANAFLATKISFINEIANICDRVGGDVTQVAQGIGLDSRIGPKFLQAGIGWGGSCFPKDVAALVHTAQDYGYNATLLKGTIATNQRQKLLVVEKLQQALKILKGKTIGLLGLTFKPHTDDMRDAPSLVLIEQLTRLGAKVKAFDPIITDEAAPGLTPELTADLAPVQIVTNVEALAVGCDALVLVTDWPDFQQLDYARLGVLMETPLMIDGRNALDRAVLAETGFTYVGIGRSDIHSIHRSPATRSQTTSTTPSLVAV
ncbi:MAG: UDP-glucose/GDP-mannose dehydrogenase family protein [Alkalinema sp. RL_2_19]|nr:UDP-glucose/GDP-mannose dehydrogenase family protein [Alkalinema sp. RL_2_19]